MTCPPGAGLSGGVCLTPAHPDAAQVHRVVSSILAQRAFRPPSKSWLSRIGTWIADRLAQAFSYLFFARGISVVGLIVSAALIVAVAVAAFRFARRIRRDPGVEIHVEDPVGRRPEEWERLALEHEAQGEWRPAVRCRYRGLVSSLAAAGVVEEVPGRTAREYARQVADRRPAVAPAFQKASDMFEAAWYGNLATGPDNIVEFRALAGRIDPSRKAPAAAQPSAATPAAGPPL